MPASRRELLREHFATLAALYDEGTFDRIDRLGITAGWRCWEAGAGGGTVAAWLAERAGPAGQVIATDVDTELLAVSVGADVEVLRHDVSADPAPGDGFDLVHARLLVEHVPDHAGALAAMAGSLRPGGWLLAESADPMLEPLACPDETGPAAALANKVRHAVWATEMYSEQKRFGRTLPRLMRAAGLTDVRSEVRIPFGGPDLVRLQRTLLARRTDRLVATGLLTREDLDRHLADLDRETLDLAALPVVAAWGCANGGCANEGRANEGRANPSE